MQYYSTREWRGKRSLVNLPDGIIDLETLSDSEFRKFILWRMGLATEDALVRVEPPTPAPRKPSRLPPMPPRLEQRRTKVREYDIKNVGRSDRRR